MNRCPVAQANLAMLTILIVRHAAAFTKNHFSSNLTFDARQATLAKAAGLKVKP